MQNELNEARKAVPLTSQLFLPTVSIVFLIHNSALPSSPHLKIKTFLISTMYGSGTKHEENNTNGAQLALLSERQ